jgi:cobalt-zinc-cadmium efflux system membrane fusion protein
MFVKAAIETGVHSTTALPNSAVVSYGGKVYVFTANDGHRFTSVEITTANSLTEIHLPESINRDAKFATSVAHALLRLIFNTEKEE